MLEDNIGHIDNVLTVMDTDSDGYITWIEFTTAKQEQKRRDMEERATATPAAP